MKRDAQRLCFLGDVLLHISVAVPVVNDRIHSSSSSSSIRVEQSDHSHLKHITEMSLSCQWRANDSMDESQPGMQQGT